MSQPTLNTAPADQTLIDQLSSWLQATDIGWLELRGPGVHLCLRHSGQQVVPVSPDALQSRAAHVVPVAATSVGRFLHKHPLQTTALAAPGLPVSRGQVMGLLQVGPLLLPVQAPQDGTVARHLAADGALVGYGTPLLELFTTPSA